MSGSKNGCPCAWFSQLASRPCTLAIHKGVLENRFTNVNGTLHFRWKFTECTEQVDIYRTQQHIQSEFHVAGYSTARTRSRVAQKSLSYARKNNKIILYGQRRLMFFGHCYTTLSQLWAQLLFSLPMAPTSRITMPSYFDHPEAEKKATESVGEQPTKPYSKMIPADSSL